MPQRPPKYPGHVSMIPTEASASTAQAGQRLWSPYMVRMKFRTKSGKRCSKMLLRMALRSCSCGRGRALVSLGCRPPVVQEYPQGTRCAKSPHHKPKAEQVMLEGSAHATPSR